MKIKQLILFLLLVTSQNTFADYFFEPMFGYNSTTSGSGGSTSTTTRQTLEFAGGNRAQSGLLLFGLYSTESNSSSGASNPRTSYGLGTGWMSTRDDGFIGQIGYFISSKDSSGSGTGIFANGGYFYALKKFNFVVQLSYRSYDYNKDASGNSLSPSSTITYIAPSIAAIFLF